MFCHNFLESNVASFSILIRQKDFLIHSVVVCVVLVIIVVALRHSHHYTHEFNLTSTFFAGFCLFYAVHGVLREREFELYAYIVGILVLLFYIIIDLIVNNNRPTLKWVSTV